MATQYIGDEYIGDEVNDLLRQAGVEGNPMDEQEIGGGAAKFRKRGGTNRYTGYLGFGPGVSIGIGATTTFQDTVQRNYQPTRLVIVPAAIGTVVDSVRIGDEEMIVGSKAIASECFDKASLNSVPDDLPAAAPGMSITVKITNPTAAAVVVSAGMKGHVLR